MYAEKKIFFTPRDEEGAEMQADRLLDGIGQQILETLQENARISFSDLGRKVGLSSPAVAERVHRLEDAGYIKGYRVVIDEEKFGYPITAFVRVSAQAGRSGDIESLARESREVIEAHRTTGSDDYLLRVIASSVAHLDEFVSKMSEFGQTTSSVVLSSPVASRTIVPAPR